MISFGETFHQIHAVFCRGNGFIGMIKSSEMFEGVVEAAPCPPEPRDEPRAGLGSLRAPSTAQGVLLIHVPNSSWTNAGAAPAPPNSVLPLPHTPALELWVMQTAAGDFPDQKSFERHHLEPKILLQTATATIQSLKQLYNH